MNLLDRKTAVMEGKKRYFTGIPCPRGHISERMVSTRACCQCVSERKHAWSINNPEKVNAQKRAWRNANIEHARELNLANQKLHRDKANARHRKYAETHREQLRIKNAEWARLNQDKAAAKFAKRRASKLQRTPDWADHDAISMIYAAAKIIRKSGFDVHVDHVVPLQGNNVAGLHVHNNLQIIPAKANYAKSNHF